MSLSKKLRNALLDDLRSINGTGIFATTVAEVSPFSERLETLDLPGIRLVPAGGDNEEADADHITFRQLQTTQSWVVEIALRDENVEDALLDFIDDVRNAVERREANLKQVTHNGAPVVDEVRASNFEPSFADEATQNQLATAVVRIVVTYTYTGGQL